MKGSNGENSKRQSVSAGVAKRNGNYQHESGVSANA